VLVALSIVVVIASCTDGTAPAPAGPEDVYREVEALNVELRRAYGRGEHYLVTAFTANDSVAPQIVVAFRKP
jgi:hypothetical protein